MSTAESPNLNAPRASDALILVGAALLLRIASAGFIARLSSPAAASATQLAVILAPVILFLAAGRFSLRESLPLARPGPRDLAGGLAIGLGLWLPAILAANLGAAVFGADFEGVGNEILRSISETQERLGLAGVILLFSVLPALVEELFFRGVILPALLRQYPRATAIWGTALLFGVFHLNLPQGFATIAIGAILGYAVARTGSLWVAVVAHAAHNAAVLLGALLAAEGQADLLFYATPVAAALLLVGTRLLPKRGRADILDVF